MYLLLYFSGLVQKYIKKGKYFLLRKVLKLFAMNFTQIQLEFFLINMYVRK